MSAKKPTIPRASSSAIIIDHNNRVLMVERSLSSKSFAGAYVFPGGVFDGKQDTSEKMTAIRETFEESGILLARPSGTTPLPSQEKLDAARKAIHSQKLSFTTFLAEHNLEPDVESLFPFTQWITPPSIPRRFHAHFFVTFLPPKVSVGSSNGEEFQQLPTSDGGLEVISVRFLRPHEAIGEVESGKISLMPPQYYLLQTLANIISGGVSTLEEKENVYRLAKGKFGTMVINPRPLPYKHEKGYIIMTYEGDETRGGAPGMRHRSLLYPKNGLMHVVRLERTFDIFQDNPLQNTDSKL